MAAKAQAVLRLQVGERGQHVGLLLFRQAFDPVGQAGRLGTEIELEGEEQLPLVVVLVRADDERGPHRVDVPGAPGDAVDGLRRGPLDDVLDGQDGDAPPRGQLRQRTKQGPQLRILVVVDPRIADVGAGRVDDDKADVRPRLQLRLQRRVVRQGERRRACRSWCERRPLGTPSPGRRRSPATAELPYPRSRLRRKSARLPPAGVDRTGGQTRAVRASGRRSGGA